ncbi:MAG: asparagine synthase C-terminal domain-containing protein, partial [Bacteroidota bacterium]
LQMQEIYDEPFADSSNIPTFLISKYASQFHKVALTGDGGDELLGGYSIWYRALLDDDKKKLKKNFIKAVAKKLLSHSQKHADAFFDKNYSPVAKQHLNQNVFFTDAELNELGLKDIDSFTTAASYNFNTADDAMRMDIENYMPGDILVKTDRASMANSLELRAPFLDIDFASFCISLPYTLKLNKENDKLILKSALTDMLPKEILSRVKQGFGAPVDRWLQLKSVSALNTKMLGNADSKIYSLLSPEKIKYIAKQNNYQTWILLVLSLWMEKHDFTIG